jgi:hypothetical protein
MRLLSSFTILLFGAIHCAEWSGADEIAQFMQEDPTVDALELLDVMDDDEPEMPKGWSNCGTTNDLFQLGTFSMTPDPPRRSSTLSVRVAGTLAEQLTGGRLNYTVSFGIIPIVQDSIELCEALKLEPKIPQCPLRSGEWDVTHHVEMPREVPFGRYVIRAAAWNNDGREIFCVEGTTVIGIMSANGNGKKQKAKQAEWNRQVEFPEEI